MPRARTPKQVVQPPSVFGPDDGGLWPLHKIVMKRDPERVHHCVRDLGHPVDALDNDNNTPLHFAVWNRRLEVIEPLLALGANPNAPNYKGHTSLHHLFARLNDKTDHLFLHHLLDYGADGLLTDQHGNTPYHMLALGTFRSAEAAHGLAQIMCDRVGLAGWGQQNQDGLTPIECARQTHQAHWMLTFTAAIEHSLLDRNTATLLPSTGTSRPGRRL